jgi:N6-adenosine-specific RNA methylase IME4
MSKQKPTVVRTGPSTKRNALARAPRRVNVPRIVSEAEAAIERATAPEEVLGVERQLDTLETMMANSGLYSPDELRAINEQRMRARHKLGALLSKIERGAGQPRNSGGGRPNFREAIDAIGLAATAAKEAQRIACMPKGELEKALARNHTHGVLSSYAGLIVAARPWWYKDSRQRRHREIFAKAARARVATPAHIGPYPLLYVDPPWKFSTYSEKGLAKTPDQHYPTLTDDEIKAFKIGDQTMPEIAAKDAALFMWCTSSNMRRAMDVMEAWGFEFGSSAVWVKDKPAHGLVFINSHEVLLYGIRGNMPGPQFQPLSVFNYPVGQHSAKPPEIRAIIEKMYPDFDEKTRAELFARTTGMVPGWSCYGFEGFGGTSVLVDAEGLADVIGQVPRVHAENDAADRSEPPRRRRA